MIPKIYKIPLNASATVMLAWQGNNAYLRYQSHVVLTTDTGSVKFGRWSLQSSSISPLAYPRYELWLGTIDSRIKKIAEYVRVGTENQGTFNWTLGPTTSGHYWTHIVAYDASGAEVATPTETLMKFGIYVDKDATLGTTQTHVISQNSTYDFTRGADGWNFFYCDIPVDKLKQRLVPNPVTMPVPAGQAPFPGGIPFNTVLPGSKIQRFNYVTTTDHTDANEVRISKDKRGILSTAGYQGYFADFWKPTPRLPEIDGERGVATSYHPLAAWIGHAGHAYVMGPHTFYRISPSGKRTTFAGLRHLNPPPLWTEMDDVPMVRTEIVGNWDPAIPTSKRFPKESWGILFDDRTTVVSPANGTAERPPFGIQPLHAGKVVAFATCAFGRILKFEFDPLNPTAPPYVTEFITGLSDPWGLAQKDGVLYVAERTKHRISKWSMDDGSYLGDAVAQTNADPFVVYGGMDNQTWRRWWPSSSTLAQRRAVNILGPEQVRIMDGYLYYGSYAQQDVRRVNMATGQLEICANIPTNDQQSRFVNFAVSDGTFYPKHTIFSTTFDFMSAGLPRMWLPTPNGSFTHTQGYYYSVEDDHTEGVGKSAGTIYPLCCEVRNGMLLTGGSGPGLVGYMQAPDGVPLTAAEAAQMKRGHEYYASKGYRRFGNYGNWIIDEPLPWGENADMDAWLRLHGHVPDAPPPPPPEPDLVVPLSVDCGSAWVGRGTPGAGFTVSNPASVARDVAVQVAGADFTLVSTPVVTIPSGSSSTIIVNAVPSAEGARTGTLTITAAPKVYTVALTATGIAPTLDERVADLERRVDGAGIPR